MSAWRAGCCLALSWLLIPGHCDLLQDALSLSQLPLDQLLKAKRALSAQSTPVERREEAEVAEGALPLRGDPGSLHQSSKDRDGWESDDLPSGWKDVAKGKGKGKGEIQSIFQLTITVLAFLAFGGYLVSLIVQAVRAGNGAIPPSAALPQGVMMVTTPVRLKRSVTTASAEDMHRALVALAEGYARYSHTSK